MVVFNRLLIGSMVIGLALYFLGCGRGISEENIVSAQNELRDFKKELKATLVAGIQNGPDKAITACNVEAPNIAARHSVDGIEIGRTSHKLRNSANAPADWVSPLLAEYVSGERDTYTAVQLENGRFGYVEPIRLEKVCLMCHGADVAPGTLLRIAPGDRVVAFDTQDQLLAILELRPDRRLWPLRVLQSE